MMSWLVALVVAAVFFLYYLHHSNCHQSTPSKCHRCRKSLSQMSSASAEEARSPNRMRNQRSPIAGGFLRATSSMGCLDLVEVYPNEDLLPIKSDQFRTCMQLCTEFAVKYMGTNEHLYNVSNDTEMVRAKLFTDYHFTDLSPGFLTRKMPAEMPKLPEKFSEILGDFYKLILPGITHWQHPRFHGYFPHGCSYPDIIGEVLVSSVGVVQFSWDSCPAITELEVVLVNWMGRAIGLPDTFLFNVDCPDDSAGGGALEPSSSDAIFIAMLAARQKKLSVLIGDRKTEPDYQKKVGMYLPLLVAYASAEAHSAVEKATRLVMISFRVVETGSDYQMTGEKLESEIQKDFQRGLIPFFVCATSGTTSVASFDHLEGISMIAKKYDLWMHVDGAYGVCARICPEFRYLMAGIENADSINMNAHKLLLASCTSSILWTKRQKDLRKAYTFNGEYLKKTKKEAMDFRHWGISLSRRAKALKLWVLFRMYGVSGLQAYIRRLVQLTDRFSNYLNGYEKVEVVTRKLTLVTFRAMAANNSEANKLTVALCEHINRSRKILLTYAKPGGNAVIRVCVCHERSTNDDIDKSWEVLKGLFDSFFGLDTVLTHNVVAHPSAPDLYCEDEDLIASPITVQSTASSGSSLSSTSITAATDGNDDEKKMDDEEHGRNSQHQPHTPPSP